jgi:hypothetical protein
MDGPPSAERRLDQSDTVSAELLVPTAGPRYTESLVHDCNRAERVCPHQVAWVTQGVTGMVSDAFSAYRRQCSISEPIFRN